MYTKVISIIKIDMDAIPTIVKDCMKILLFNNYQVYLVGGCVRDMLLDEEPKDWDLCTNAEAEDIITLFSTGKYVAAPYTNFWKTVVVKSLEDQNNIVEITPYKYGTTIDKDLLHRDFTVNAIAVDINGNLYDPYNGNKDCSCRYLTTHANPYDIIREDPLRILRAIRFACTKKFEISAELFRAMNNCRDMLKIVAPDRIYSELCKILLSNDCCKAFIETSDILSIIIPEFADCVGFNQHSIYHIYTVYDHMMRSVDQYKNADIIIKLALFLHDIGKPQCYVEDENKVGHFPNHAKVSAELAYSILTRLRCPNDIRDKVVELIKYHNDEIGLNRKSVNKIINKIGIEQLRRLLSMKEADIRSQSVHTDDIYYTIHCRLRSIKDIINKLEEEHANKAVVFTLRDLEIDGNDILDLGFEPGPIIGKILKSVLNAIINEEIHNTYDECINYVKNIYSK